MKSVSWSMCVHAYHRLPSQHVGLLWCLPKLLQILEEGIHHSPSTGLMEPRRSAHCRNWHIRLHLRYHPLYHRPFGQRSPPDSLSLSNFHVPRTKLQCTWQGTPGHLRSVQVLGPLPRRNSSPNQYHHRPQEPQILFHYQSPDTVTSPLVGIPVTIQPCDSFPSW